MKLTSYNESVNERYPVPVLGPKYPDYYILNIGDIVRNFVAQWDNMINTEIMNHPIDANIVFPEVYTIADDGSVFKQTFMKKHVSEQSTSWHPDISLIIAAAIENIKTKKEINEDLDLAMGMLWIDVAHMADIQLQSNIPGPHVAAAISNTRRKIATLATQFGKQLYQRLVEYGMYKHGRFPYHYVGWQDDCAIVALDDDAPDPLRGLDFISE
jgi:hypothetical protein